MHASLLRSPEDLCKSFLKCPLLHYLWAAIRTWLLNPSGASLPNLGLLTASLIFKTHYWPSGAPSFWQKSGWMFTFPWDHFWDLATFILVLFGEEKVIVRGGKYLAPCCSVLCLLLKVPYPQYASLGSNHLRDLDSQAFIPLGISCNPLISFL